MKMNEMIKSFPNQFFEQYDNLKNKKLDLEKFKDIRNIVIVGMGGSAISGDLVSSLVKNEVKIPIHVIRDYTIPHWTDNSTLFIFSSYSGNTEETISCFNSALSRSEMLLSICTGGELQKLSTENNVEVFSLPIGYQPRAALGLSMMTLFLILNNLNLLKIEFVKDVLKGASTLDLFYDDFCSKNSLAYEIAEKLNNSVISIYGVYDSTDHIASRLRAQLAENSKILAGFNVLPEMNHNEIEAWNKKQFGEMRKNVVWIFDKDDHPRNLDRIKITSSLLNEVGVYSTLISVDGENYIERCLKVLFLNDWISFYLADINRIDPVPVNRIMDLKNKMS